MNEKVALFEEKEIRKKWEDGEWYFCIEDVVLALTDSKDPKQYIKKMRKRDSFLSEGWVQIVHHLKIETNGGIQKVNCANTKGILRIIQSIPSIKAEPFKIWLAKVGSERIEEINNPELAMDRMKTIYEKKGYSKTWIEQRERGITTRHSLTDEWRARGAKVGIDYAILTDEIYKTGFGISAKQYKKIKGIDESKNLRDSMTNLELALTNLGEATAVEIHIKDDSYGMGKLSEDMNRAGSVVREARIAIENQLESPVVTKDNFEKITNKQKLN